MQALAEAVTNPLYKMRFKSQLQFLSVRSRTEKTFGYYTDFCFKKDTELEAFKLADDFNKNPPCVIGIHPNVEDCIFFLAYVKDGAIDFLEASATGHWPENEEAIIIEAED